jgi:hypothetical protein
MSQLRTSSPVSRAIRCHARSRTGQPCRNPCVSGWKVCRHHGVGGGAPVRNRNAWKHGRYSAEHLAESQKLRELIQDSRRLVDMVNGRRQQ